MKTPEKKRRATLREIYALEAQVADLQAQLQSVSKEVENKKKENERIHASLGIQPDEVPQAREILSGARWKEGQLMSGYHIRKMVQSYRPGMKAKFKPWGEISQRQRTNRFRQISNVIEKG